jgi:modulator of FtsH protease HflK
MMEGRSVIFYALRRDLLAATVFRQKPTYKGNMTEKSGWIARAGALFMENGGPWGGSGGGGDSGGSGKGPRNPWSQPPGGGKPRGPRGVSAMDELTRRMRDRFGGNGGGGDGGEGGAMPWPLVRIGALVIGLAWILLTSFHSVGPQERGVVTRFGGYSRTLNSGVSLTFPWPVESVSKLNVAEIRVINIPEGNETAENFILTGDQNIVDLDYSVRWSIADPELYLFQIRDPDTTIREVAESAMRASISRTTLIGAIGAQRGQIEADVERIMRSILSSYQSGVRIDGVAIKRADPPSAVNEAFKDVTAAQQEAQSAVNQANTYAQQVTQRALGEAGAFDKVYEQYKLSPVVTRRRMYYETMEEVLAKVDKTIVEAPGVTPYLPLQEMRKRAPAAATEAAQ